MNKAIFHSKNSDEQHNLGQCLAKSNDGNQLIIFLQGELGAGKTTLVQGILKGLHYQGKVKSPTYSLIESYDINEQIILHIDLYRLAHADEAIALDLIPQIDNANLCCIEWPERAYAHLPHPDLKCTIDFAEQGRTLHFDALTESGSTVLNKMVKEWQ